MKTRVLGIFVFVLLHAAALAQPGSINTSFANNGYKIINMDTFDVEMVDYVYKNNKATVLGKILKSDYSGGYRYSFFVARLNSNGTFDNTFGVGGIYEISNSNYSYEPRALHVYTNGSVLVGGTRIQSGNLNRAILYKLNSLGYPDDNFYNGSPQRILFNSETATINDLFVDNNSNIYVCGEKVIPPATIPKAYIARFTSAVAPDVNFDVDGVLNVDFGQSTFTAFEVGNSITYATGYSGIGEIVIVAVNNNNGSLNTAFDTDGKLSFDVVTSAQEYPYDIVYNSSESAINICGYSGGQPFICQLNTNGTFDNNFSGDGKRVINVGPSFNIAKNLLLYSNTIYMGVHLGNSSFAQVLAINPADGTDELSFGTGGTKDINFFLGQDVDCSSIRLYGNGVIGMLGMTFTPTLGNTAQMGLATVNANSGSDMNYFENFSSARLVSAIHKSNEGMLALELQNNKLLVSGFYSNEYEGKLYGRLMRYHTDGTPDQSFYQYWPEPGFYANRLLVRNDQSILLGGMWRDYGTDNYSVMVQKLDSNGVPDSSFGINSFTSFPFGLVTCYINNMIELGDGSIIACGNKFEVNSGNNAFACKFLPSGAIDVNFDGDGLWEVLHSADEQIKVYDLFQEQNGTIVLVVLYYNSATDVRDIGFIKMAPDGSVIGNIIFGGLQEGLTDHPFDFGTVSCAHLPDGRFYLSTAYTENNVYGLKMARFQTDLTLDNTFANNGSEKILDPAFQYMNGEMLIGPDMKPVFTYSRFDTALVGFINFTLGVVHRMDTTGADDITFSFDGKALIQYNNIYTRLDDIILHPNGNLYLSGLNFNFTDADFLLTSVITEHNVMSVGPVTETLQEYMLYPNPVSYNVAYLRLSEDVPGESSVYLWDVQGHCLGLLYYGELKAGNIPLTLPTDLAAGNYIAEIRNAAGRKSILFQKQ